MERDCILLQYCAPLEYTFFHKATKILRRIRCLVGYEPTHMLSSQDCDSDSLTPCESLCRSQNEIVLTETQIFLALLKSLQMVDISRNLTNQLSDLVIGISLRTTSPKPLHHFSQSQKLHESFFHVICIQVQHDKFWLLWLATAKKCPNHAEQILWNQLQICLGNFALWMDRPCSLASNQQTCKCRDKILHRIHCSCFFANSC